MKRITALAHRVGAGLKPALLGLGLVAALTALPVMVTAQPDTLIQPGDLTYLGAFRLPQDTAEDIGWLYAGQGLAYYPGGDPGGPDDGFPGSLFGIGHDWNQFVSEISIPVPVVSRNVGDLNTAATLQPFANLREGLPYDYLEQARAGLAYLPPQGEQTSGKLYFAWGPHLPEENRDPSHGWAELDLSNPQTAGLWTVAGRRQYETVDYLFPVAPEWAADYAPGMLLATGRFREGGQLGCGPALFAFAPWESGNPPAPNADLPAVTLLQYGIFSGPDSQKLDGYHDSDDWSGGAWLVVGEKSAVAFVGTKGTGEYWYGFSNGVIWPEDGPYPDVPDYPHDQRGFWSTGYEAQIIFYDPADLGAVARGEMESWEPQPYAVLSIDAHLYGSEDTPVQKPHRVGAAAFDAARGLLYVVEPTAIEQSESVIHVWQVGP